MSGSEPVARRIVVRGRVQGVSYRWWAVETARLFGVAGWVRNRRDGSVEALVMGTQEAVAGFVEACREGPAAARVDSIDEQPAKAEPTEVFTMLSSV